MWFKVVFNKDGSVAECTHVEGVIRQDGKGVAYVDAPNATLAIASARRWFQNLKERTQRQRAARKDSGLCRCGAELDAPERSLIRCRVCLDKEAAGQSRRNAGVRLPAEQRREAARKNLDKARASSVGRHMSQLKLMLETRDAFWRLSGPAFADWLEARIVVLGGEPRTKAAE